MFSAATVVLGLGTFMAAGDVHGLPAVLYGVAAASYGWVTYSAWRILETQSFRVVDGADRWWPSHGIAEPQYVRSQLLDDLTQAFAENRDVLEAKGRPLDMLLVATALEAIFVAAAVIAFLA